MKTLTVVDVKAIIPLTPDEPLKSPITITAELCYDPQKPDDGLITIYPTTPPVRWCDETGEHITETTQKLITRLLEILKDHPVKETTTIRFLDA